jgi:hypothetical protein
MKNLIKKLKKLNPDTDNNIFNSVYDINLKDIIGYKKDGKKYSIFE